MAHVPTKSGPPGASPLASGLLIIFGITGDLSRRYLLPALYNLATSNLLPPQFVIIGATRKGVEVSVLLSGIRIELERRGQTADSAVLSRLGAMMQIIIMDPAVAGDYQRLKATLDGIEDDRGVCLNRLFYLSIPPHTYGPVVDQLGASGLNSGCSHGVADSRIMVEKPFGYDLQSAQDLIDRLHKHFDESQIYRIDHYLAKETVQNILVFRFNNPLFEGVWDRHHISEITITASETIGIENRAAFYESTGALRDFVQNHLLQLLAITTMERPAELDSKHIHAAKLQLLNAIQPVAADEVPTMAARGQYKGYREEVGNPRSSTETFARLLLSIDTDRWRGMPVMLKTGKRLDRRLTEITIRFANLYGHKPNTLSFRIQPNEGIGIDVQAKKPGFDQQTEQVEMEFNYKDYFSADPGPDAYERVLMDGIRGDQTLFASSDEVLASWAIVDAVVKQWAKTSEGLNIYQPGTSITEL